MNKTRTQRLNELFVEWKQRTGEEANRMCLDGIIREENYESVELKLLFVAKEPNHPEGPGFDFREAFSKEVKYAFSKRLCEWAYGVWNGFPSLSEFDAKADTDKLEVIRSISFMNLKKVGGAGSADHERIRSITDRDKDLLRRQIEIIDPDVIIGGVGNSSLWSLLFPEIALQNCGFDIPVARVGRVRVIDFYHPSYRVPRAMSYSLLGRVFQSDEFRSC